jgi:hypothetical protein
MIGNEKPRHAATWQGSKSQALGQGLHANISPFRLERKRPAYAGEVEAMLRAGRQPNVYAYAGRRCWDRARIRLDGHGMGSVMVLADDVPPDCWRWPAGLDALVLAVDGVEPARALAIARAAVAGGVRCVVVCGLDQPAIVRRASA